MDELPAVCEVAHGSAGYWATVELRDAILRRPLGLCFTKEELEAERDSRHIACYLCGKLVGCLVLCPADAGPAKSSVVRMRQVAVVAEMRGQGIGTVMVKYSEVLACKLGYRRMILHARETAVAFYERLGYTRIGDRFEEVTVPHWAMEKCLADSWIGNAEEE